MIFNGDGYYYSFMKFIFHQNNYSSLNRQAPKLEHLTLMQDQIQLLR